MPSRDLNTVQTSLKLSKLVLHRFFFLFLGTNNCELSINSVFLVCTVADASHLNESICFRGNIPSPSIVAVL